ncbi:short chain dehydrogenase/reductase family oxidoreductase [Penicillium malachiteum]|nr:short chain dehydrogenase/reductase family oxidoreductase [Penicillium malachiteum]
MALKLSGSAFITGAASGIGKSTARAFARHGVTKLALLDLNRDGLDDTQKLLKAHHPEIDTIILEGDASVESTVQNSIELAAKKFERIDYAVNCAGISGPYIPAHELPLKEWQGTLDINLTGVWLCQKYLIKQMLGQEIQGDREGRGSIINVSSMFGRVSSPGFLSITPYTTSKHAIVGLTKADASTYGPLGIRINAICPGYVETPMSQPALQTGVMDSEVKGTPVGRVGTPDEISDVITFLASPMASFMYGVALPVDGGYSL